MTEALVAFDTDKIKRYVFETSTLKEIRGASALIDGLNRQSMPALVGGEMIYANGGAGLFVIPNEEAETAIQTVRRLYQHETHSASITGVSVPISHRTQGLQDRLSLLRHHFHLAKTGVAVSSVNLLTNSLIQFCDSCGTRYAQIIDGEEMICKSCQRKRQENYAVKTSIERWATGEETPDQQRLWGRLFSALTQRGYPVVGYDRPDDFESIGRQSTLANTMGLIYADGDGMGRIIETIRSLSTYKRFAESVDNALYYSVTDAIQIHLQPTNDSVWPFDVLLLGGDDLVMLTRSQSALAVAQQIVERFSQVTQELWGEPLTLSAAVVLANVKYPIGSLIRLAESSLKFAKREAARRKLSSEIIEGGLINFLVVNSANHLNFDDFYQEVLKHYDHNTTLYRSQRPYSVKQMQTLLKHIRRLRDTNVSRRKLEQLRSAAFKSYQQGTIDGMMAVLRVRNASQREALFSLIGDTHAEQIYLPWKKRNDRDWTTPVVDIAELIDFID